MVLLMWGSGSWKRGNREATNLLSAWHKKAEVSWGCSIMHHNYCKHQRQSCWRCWHCRSAGAGAAA